jgi:hypothetical protein
MIADLIILIILGLAIKVIVGGSGEAGHTGRADGRTAPSG